MNYIKWLFVLFLISLIGAVAFILLKENSAPSTYSLDIAKTGSMLRSGMISPTKKVEKELDDQFKYYCGNYTDEKCRPFIIYEWIGAEFGFGKTKEQLLLGYNLEEILKYKYNLYFNNDLNDDYAWGGIHFTILAMNQLDLLSENEKGAWVVKYANHKTTTLKHKSRQLSLFITFADAKTIEDLSSIPALDIKNAISNVCKPIPELTEDNDPCGALNYINFKLFCVHEINVRDKAVINKITTNDYKDSLDKEVFDSCTYQIKKVI